MSGLTKEQVAARMNGREYGDELLTGEQAELRAARLIVLFGYSDDVVEVRGVDNDEFGTGDLFFNESGLIKNRCEEEFCPYWREVRDMAEGKVEVFDDGDEFGMFEFRTAIPHALFKIMEDGELYGSGIVFSLDDLAARNPAGAA